MSQDSELNNTHFDAIKLLEGALLKMDGIISLGTYFKLRLTFLTFFFITKITII